MKADIDGTSSGPPPKDHSEALAGAFADAVADFHNGSLGSTSPRTNPLAIDFEAKDEEAPEAPEPKSLAEQLDLAVVAEAVEVDPYREKRKRKSRRGKKKLEKPQITDSYCVCYSG